MGPCQFMAWGEWWTYRLSPPVVPECAVRVRGGGGGCGAVSEEHEGRSMDGEQPSVGEISGRLNAGEPPQRRGVRGGGVGGGTSCILSSWG